MTSKIVKDEVCVIYVFKTKKQRTIQMEYTKISCQVNWYNFFFMFLDAAMFLKQLNDHSNQHLN